MEIKHYKNTITIKIRIIMYQGVIRIRIIMCQGVMIDRCLVILASLARIDTIAHVGGFILGE